MVLLSPSHILSLNQSCVYYGGWHEDSSPGKATGAHRQNCFCWIITFLFLTRDIHYRLRIFPELSLWAQEKISNTFLFFPCQGLQLLQGHISFRTHFLYPSSLPLPWNSPLIVYSCLWKIWAISLFGLNLNMVILFQQMHKITTVLQIQHWASHEINELWTSITLNFSVKSIFCFKQFLIWLQAA